MTTLVDAQSVVIATGLQSIGPMAFPDSVNSIEFLIARCTSADLTIWPNVSTTLDFRLYVSYDGGVTWEFQSGQGNSPGGILPRGDGTDLQYNRCQLVGLRAIPARQLRGDITVTNGPLVTKVTVNVA